MSATVEQMLAVARAQVGILEQPTNRTKFGAWYGMDGQPWCDMFVSWVAATAGCGGEVGKFAWTVAHANWFLSRGRWGTTPRVGAIVFFDWEGSSGLDRIDHVGIVESVNNDGSIGTIEGNTSAGGTEGVYRRTRKSYIVGYGYPSYVHTPAHAAVPVAGRTVMVRAGQTLSGIAAALGLSVAAMMGVNAGMNPNVIHPGQTLNVPAPAPAPAAKAPVNRVTPPVKACPPVPVKAQAIPYPGYYVRFGTQGSAAKLVQAKVGAVQDGMIGPNSVRSIKAWQTSHHVTADGVVGPQTWRVMFA